MPIPSSSRLVGTRKNTFLVSNQAEVAAVEQQGNAIAQAGNQIAKFVKQMEQVRDGRDYNRFVADTERQMVDLREKYRTDTDYETRTKRFEADARQIGEARIQNLRGEAAERGRAFFESSLTGNVARSNLEAAAQEISAYDADVNEQLPGLLNAAADPTNPEATISQLRAEQLIQDGVDAGVYSESIGQRKIAAIRNGMDWERAMVLGRIDPQSTIKRIRDNDILTGLSPLKKIEAMERVRNQYMEDVNRSYTQDLQQARWIERQRKVRAEVAEKKLTDLFVAGSLTHDAISQYRDDLTAKAYDSWEKAVTTKSATTDDIMAIENVYVAMETNDPDTAHGVWKENLHRLTVNTAKSLRADILRMDSAVPLRDAHNIEFFKSQIARSPFGVTLLDNISRIAEGNGVRDYREWAEGNLGADDEEAKKKVDELVQRYAAYKQTEHELAIGTPKSLQGVPRDKRTVEMVDEMLAAYLLEIEGQEETPEHRQEKLRYRVIITNLENQ